MTSSSNLTSCFQEATSVEQVLCPICNGAKFTTCFEAKDYKYKLPGKFIVSCCCGCGLILQNPRPEFQDILRYYPAEYEHLMEHQNLVTQIKRSILNGPRTRLYQQLLGKKARVLDVGCGAGTLLKALNRRHPAWELQGIEPSAPQSNSFNQIKIYAGTLEEAKFDDNMFDLVIMNHVLEHVPSPYATAKEVFRILKPNGYFCGEVPNIKCLERRIFGQYWSGYHLPRHLTFFDQHTLAALLTKSGFSLQAVTTQMQPSNWLESATNYLSAKKAPVFFSNLFTDQNVFWLGLTTPLAWLRAKCGSASAMRFICQRSI